MSSEPQPVKPGSQVVTVFWLKEGESLVTAKAYIAKMNPWPYPADSHLSEPAHLDDFPMLRGATEFRMHKGNCYLVFHRKAREQKPECPPGAVEVEASILPSGRGFRSREIEEHLTCG